MPTAGRNHVRRLCVAIVALLSCAVAERAQGACCVCEGVTLASNECEPFVNSCDAICPGICAALGGTVRACCETFDCSGGVADSCPAQHSVCDQTAIGPGFCDGSCTDSVATATPTVTATATVTGTATETPTATPVPQGGGCSDTAECVPGLFCADGVCCDTACDQPEQQCNLEAHAGTCSTTAAEAPAMTRTGLLAAAALLIGIAALALTRRLRRG
jgi:hypothetical protein